MMKAVFLDFETLGPSDIDIAPLREQLPRLQVFDHTSPDDVAARIDGAEIVIVNKVRLDAGILSAASSLELICVAATGTDNVDLDAAKAKNIDVVNIRDYCTPSVVQHVFALILSLTNHLREYDDSLEKGAWQGGTSFTLLDHPIRELHGKTLGIVGFGALGRAVAEVGRAFGMRVIAAVRPGARSVNGVDGVYCTDLETLLAEADIVSLHCPLTDATHELINRRSLDRMRNDAILINTARGGLVDAPALIDALRNGVIAGAGIDVLREEPPAGGDPLLEANLPNLVVTPHIAWSARESRQRAVEALASNVSQFKASRGR